METEVSAELPKRVEFDPIALAERKWRLLIATVLTPGTLALFLLLVRIAVPFEEVRRFNDFNSPIINFFEPARFAIVTISLGLMTVAGVLLLYLQTGFRKQNILSLEVGGFGVSLKTQPNKEESGSELRAVIEKLESKVEALAASNTVTSAQLNPDALKGLAEDLKKRVEREAASSILTQIRKEVETAGIEEHARNTLQRLARETEALSFRGNVNLIFGVIITIVGIGFLVFFVLFKQAPVDPKVGPWWYLAQFVPRLSLVVLIEVFAYFFLRLYRSNLSDIKYFQNEMTNVESKVLALRGASGAGDQKTAAAVLLRLAETERNYLKKDETTVEIERGKTDRDNAASLLKEMLSLLKKGE